MNIFRPLRDAKMAEYAATFLREPSHIDDACGLSVEIGGGAENLRHRHDAGAADARDDDAVSAVDRRQCRLWQRGEIACGRSGAGTAF